MCRLASFSLESRSLSAAISRIGSSGRFNSSPRLGAEAAAPPSLSGGIRANRGNYAIIELVSQTILGLVLDVLWWASVQVHLSLCELGELMGLPRAAGRSVPPGLGPSPGR